LDYDPITERVALGLEATEDEDSQLTKEETLRQCFLSVLDEYERLSTTELDARVKELIPAHQTVVQEVREGLLAEGVIIKNKAGKMYFWSLVEPVTYQIK
jgi:hypothetical protein